MLLIDEIDKAETDFQDDMLDVLDQMRFDIIETDEVVTALKRPVIIITSNAKRDLSDPISRAVATFTISPFPDPKMMRKIIDAHFPDINHRLAQTAIETHSMTCGALTRWRRSRQRRELINWIRALQADPDFRNGDRLDK